MSIDKNVEGGGHCIFEGILKRPKKTARDLGVANTQTR
jgi:hypothetical protein